MTRSVLYVKKIILLTAISLPPLLAEAVGHHYRTPVNTRPDHSAHSNGASRISLKADSIDKFRMIDCSHQGVAADPGKALMITFNREIDVTTLKNIVITEGGAEREPINADTKTVSGKWEVSNHSKTISFRPSRRFRPGIFISVTLPESFKSSKAEIFTGGKDIISFMLDNGVRYGQRIINIDTLKVVDGNVIPLVISVPENPGKHPVMIFVHGGGWSGGTSTRTVASLPVGFTANYLCNKLGVAVVGVGYRCIGSKGSFAKAKADIEDAISYVKTHAEEYNFDLNKMGICGESAGAPLSALIAQEDKSIKYFIGWNGIYDFVHDNDGSFGKGNGYGQEDPTAEANSAIYHVRSAPPATLLIHGTKDKAINYRQSFDFGQAIKSAGGSSKLILFEGQPHWYYYAPGGKYEISTLYQVKTFLTEQMALQVK